jgi:hypothetical protein
LKKANRFFCVTALIHPALVFLLLSRLAGADEDEAVRIMLCICMIMMQKYNIRRMTPFRRAIHVNVARRSMWECLITPARPVSSKTANRHSTLPIVEKMNLGSEAEFRLGSTTRHQKSVNIFS